MASNKENINKNGVILYDGPSLIDGKPIVAIATALTETSSNVKTGDMIQIWIMRSDIAPTDAWKTDCDTSVCGDCPLRKVDGHRVCYVTLFQAPLSIYKDYKNGKYLTAAEYPDLTKRMMKKPIRVGAYGDPAAVPAETIIPYLDRNGKWTGYTHQWSKDIAKPWRAYLQASVETDEQAKQAQQQGWKYFRVFPENVNIPKGLVKCKGGDTTMCTFCGRCNGRKANVYTVVHGAGKNFFPTK